MSTCACQSASIDLLNVAKFEPVKQIIKDKGLAHVNDQCNLMFCSPVGNQELFGSKVKANVVLSGFCVAPDAAIAFAKDLQHTSFQEATVDNTFNTDNMRKGIKKIFKSIGIMNNDLFEESKDDVKLAGSAMKLLMTQLLCMISPCGSSHADDVMRMLSCHKEIREEAEHCLCCWVKRIEENVDEGSIILLMGNDALKLIEETTFYFSNGYQCKIFPDEKPKKNSLLSYLNKDYLVVPIIHASGINWTKLEEKWYEKEERAMAHRSLLECFSTNEIEKELPALS